MTGWPRALVLLGALVGVLVAPPAQAADRAADRATDRATDRAGPHRVLCTFQGHDVFESSGLVDRGATLFTVNDSGDDAVVYGVDARTGRTVSRTRYADEVADVEALAPGADGTVWAGDTGDNRANRDDVAVYRLRPLDGDQPAPRYPLDYPDGPHDAEAVLVHPRTQQVFVVSKSVFGGTVYAAPRDLRADGRANRLRVFARVAGLVTDGAFLPDGRHVLLRTYGTASVYTFPGFEEVGTLALPAQRQGEGISVGADGRVLVSSEGTATAVQEVDLPAGLSTSRAGSPVGSPAGTPAGIRNGTSQPAAEPRRLRDWGGIAVVTVAVAALGWLTVRGSRVRGPRVRGPRGG